VITENQEIQLPLLRQKQISLFMKREDLIHPFISGNKYRKLKYNLVDAEEEKHRKLLTFGGAFSNHIAATAYTGKLKGFKTIGIIRGEELKNKWKNNPTLAFASKNGMQFKFVTRDWYRDKNTIANRQELRKEFGKVFVIPEGGSNELAVKGCEEILTREDAQFQVLASCVGTGGTIAGIINASLDTQEIIGFPVLKGDFLSKDICKFVQKSNWKLENNYHFGGYAKVTKELIAFINDFKEKTNIPLEPVYTGKMMFGLLDLISKDYFKPGTKILAVHTGGLQGLQGMNTILKKKNLPLLHL